MDFHTTWRPIDDGEEAYLYPTKRLYIAAMRSGCVKTVQIRVFWCSTVVASHELQFDTFLTCANAIFNRINSTDILLINIGLLLAVDGPSLDGKQKHIDSGEFREIPIFCMLPAWQIPRDQPVRFLQDLRLLLSWI